MTAYDGEGMCPIITFVAMDRDGILLLSSINMKVLITIILAICPPSL